MEEALQTSSKFQDSIDTDDSQYLCGLSTVLVAYIQELKDRMSQVEFIFCSQLFPSFQSRSKSLQKRLLEAKKTANDEWKKRESSLLHQIKELHLEKQCAQEEVQQLNVALKETKTRLLSTEKLVSKYEQEKMQLLAKVENLERNGAIIANLKEQLCQKSDKVADGMKLQEKLLQQIEIKNHNLLAEQSKSKVLSEEFNKFKDSYKDLKSQYNLLLSKIGDSKEHKPHQDRTGEEKDSPSLVLSKRSLRDSEHEDKEISPLSSRSIEVTIEILENDGLQKNPVSKQDIGFVKPSHDKSCISSSSTSISLPPKGMSANTKSEPSIGQKRSASYWRETRLHQEPGCADPHDDFLDIPMETVRNLNMGPQEEVQDLPVLAHNDMDFNNSNDEMQEVVNPDAVTRKPTISVVGPAVSKGFKYSEPE